MSTVVIALLVGIFCLWFIVLYIRHRADDHSNDDTIPNNFVTHVSAGDDGLDQELIEKFPIMVYAEVKGLKIGKVQLECAVCLNEFQDHESLRLLTSCDHVFHHECIDAWLKSHATCPVFRTVLKPENGSLKSPVDVVVAAEQQAVLNASNTSLVTGQEPPNQISINMLNPTAENCPPRSIPDIDRKLPRSHSTGHPSLAQKEAGDLEKYTLRLPEEVREQIEANSALKINGTAVWPKEESSRIGYRSSGTDSEEGDSKTGSLSSGYERFDRGTKTWSSFTPARPFYPGEAQAGHKTS